MRVTHVQLEPGDRIVFCSDGIPEAENEEGAEFNYERTAATVHMGCRRNLDAQQLVAHIIDTAKAFTGGAAQLDDQTVAVLGVE